MLRTVKRIGKSLNLGFPHSVLRTTSSVLLQELSKTLGLSRHSSRSETKLSNCLPVWDPWWAASIGHD